MSIAPATLYFRIAVIKLMLFSDVSDFFLPTSVGSVLVQAMYEVEGADPNLLLISQRLFLDQNLFPPMKINHQS